MEWLFDPHVWIALFTLSALEIVLGIDNLVFLAILADRVSEEQRPLAEKLGLGFALVTRLCLLASMMWIVGLDQPLVSIFGQPVSWRDLILIGGGVFLLAKATHEIHGSLEGDEDEQPRFQPDASGTALLWPVVAQMGILDIVFSLDSVITAVGMSNNLGVMAAAVILAMGVMLAAAAPLSTFISTHPTIKMLALSFLLMIGMMLISEGLGVHVPKGYLYFAMGFSVTVETLNLIARRRKKHQAPVKLRHPVG